MLALNESLKRQSKRKELETRVTTSIDNHLACKRLDSAGPVSRHCKIIVYSNYSVKAHN